LFGVQQELCSVYSLLWVTAIERREDSGLGVVQGLLELFGGFCPPDWPDIDELLAVWLG